MVMMLEDQEGDGCSYSGSRGGENSNVDGQGMEVCGDWTNNSCQASKRGLEDNKSNNQLNKWIDGRRELSDKYGNDDDTDENVQGRRGGHKGRQEGGGGDNNDPRQYLATRGRDRHKTSPSILLTMSSPSCSRSVQVAEYKGEQPVKEVDNHQT